MVVVTPTYAGDLELFAEMHASFLRWFPDHVRHLVVTPQVDLMRFAQFSGPRCEVWSVHDVLPKRLVSVPFLDFMVDPGRPFPPVRGWIRQQLVKLAAAAQAEAPTVVLVDADVTFVRRVCEETFVVDGRARTFRQPGGIESGMQRHMIWQREARRLLGLEPPPPPPLTDYVSALNVWESDVARALLSRVEAVAGGSWQRAVASKLHFSEFILYGVFLDEVLRPGERVEERSLCAAYWERVPLTEDGGVRLGASLSPEQVAVMISSKSRTPAEVRRIVVATASAG